MSGWRFLTTCVNVSRDDVGKLNACIEAEREVTYRTFRQLLGGDRLDFGPVLTQNRFRVGEPGQAAPSQSSRKWIINESNAAVRCITR